MDATTGLRERKKARTRLLLREAAVDLFRRQGFDATTVAQIAAAAEVSEPTFFRYFPSKVAVALAPLADGIGATIDLVVERPIGEGPLDACIAATEAAAAIGLVPPREAAADLRVLRGSTQLGAGVLAVFDDATDRLASDFAARLGTDREDAVARQTAAAVVATMLAVFRAWMDDPTSVDPPRAAAEGFRRLQRGLR